MFPIIKINMVGKNTFIHFMLIIFCSLFLFLPGCNKEAHEEEHSSTPLSPWQWMGSVR